ncbi:MAG: MFS transporter [Candidatus Lokiarchaeota archaeon]|nr:MFS transporter [Candidatus Lokiarchaeota archaeon]
MFWAGQIASIFGSGIVFFVLVWYITDTTQDPIAISTAVFTYFIPMIIISPIAGIISDRYDRRKLILLVDSLQAFSTFILILFFILNLMQFWILLIFVAIRSICQAFHAPTANAIIPTMVPKDKLSRINGINFLFTSFVNVIGPVVGGFLLLFFTVQEALWIDVITFLIALIPLLLIKIPRVKKLPEKHERDSFYTSFKEGVNIIHGIPGLLSMMITFMILNFLSQPRGTLMAYFIKVDHGGTVLVFSLVSMAFNIGMFIGGITTSVKKNWKHKMRMIYVAYIIMSIGNILLATTPTGNIPLLMIYATIIGVTGPIINSLYFTIIHLKVPHDKVGRVISIDTTLSFVAMPLGTLLAGPLAMAIGTPILFLSSAILVFITITLIYIFSNVRSLDTIKEIEIEEHN